MPLLPGISVAFCRLLRQLQLPESKPIAHFWPFLTSTAGGYIDHILSSSLYALLGHIWLHHHTIPPNLLMKPALDVLCVREECTYTRVVVCTEAKGYLECHSSREFYLFCDRVSHYPGIHLVGSVNCAKPPRDLPVSALSAPGLQLHITMANFFKGIN